MANYGPVRTGCRRRLLVDAIKFLPPGGAAERKREGFCFRCAITARIPLPPRIFGSFAQADGTSNKKTGGIGLGLSIVER